MNKEHSTITQITIMKGDNTRMNQLAPSIRYTHLSQNSFSFIPPSHYSFELSQHDATHNTHHLSNQSLCTENSNNRMNQSQVLFQLCPVLNSHIIQPVSLHRVISLRDLFVSRIIWSVLSYQSLCLSLTHSHNRPLHVQRIDSIEDE